MNESENASFRVAVDVGNSSIKFAAQWGQRSSGSHISGAPVAAGMPAAAVAPAASSVVSDESRLRIRDELLGLRVHRILLNDPDWQSQLDDELKSWLPGNGADSPIQWRIASVNSIAQSRLSDWITTHRNRDTQQLIARADIGMRAEVRNPERVGIDRLLGTQCAFLLAGRRPAICIDAGTTITVDLVDAMGVFRGGAIVPGLGLQLSSLHQATDKLPLLVPEDELSQLEVPGRDTAAAMQAGIAYAALGAIERLIDSMIDTIEHSGRVEHVFLTGGDAPRLSPALRRKHDVVPDMPLRGLYFSELCNDPKK